MIRTFRRKHLLSSDSSLVLSTRSRTSVIIIMYVSVLLIAMTIIWFIWFLCFLNRRRGHLEPDPGSVHYDARERTSAHSRLSFGSNRSQSMRERSPGPYSPSEIIREEETFIEFIRHSIDTTPQPNPRTFRSNSIV